MSIRISVKPIEGSSYTDRKRRPKMQRILKQKCRREMRQGVNKWREPRKLSQHFLSVWRTIYNNFRSL